MANPTGADRSDDDSVDEVIRGLYARGNMIKRRFFMCSEDVKITLFRSYCSSFYCCALWSDEKRLIHRVKVCHNNVFMLFIRTNFKDSISSHFIRRGLANFDIVRRKAVASLYRRLISSQNTVPLSQL